MDLWDHYREFTDAPAFYLAKTDDGTICVGLFNWERRDTTLTVGGFRQNASFTDFKSNAKFEILDGKLSIPLQGIHSVLLKYHGPEIFRTAEKTAQSGAFSAINSRFTKSKNIIRYVKRVD